MHAYVESLKKSSFLKVFRSVRTSKTSKVMPLKKNVDKMGGKCLILLAILFEERRQTNARYIKSCRKNASIIGKCLLSTVLYSNRYKKHGRTKHKSRSERVKEGQY